MYALTFMCVYVRFNETRLKDHIINPYRGCRHISAEARERVRAADNTPTATLTSGNTTAAVPVSAVRTVPNVPVVSNVPATISTQRTAANHALPSANATQLRSPAHPKPQPQSQPSFQPPVQPQPQSRLSLQPSVQPKPQPQSRLSLQPHVQPKPQAQSRHSLQPQEQTLSQPQPQPQPQSQPQVRPQPQTQLKSQPRHSLPVKRRRSETITPPGSALATNPMPSAVLAQATVAPELKRENDAKAHIAVEFSMTNGTLMRATWIAAELLNEFHQYIRDLGLVPCASDNIFNIWIGGKIAWSRGIDQPLPDYEHLRPIIRAQCCQTSTQ